MVIYLYNSPARRAKSNLQNVLNNQINITKYCGKKQSKSLKDVFLSTSVQHSESELLDN